MLITLIRHSKTNPTGNIPIKQWGLTEEGILMAKALAKTDKIKSISVLYTSLQTKALETAVILAKDHGIPMKINDNLTEITSFTEKFHSDPEIYEQNTAAFYNGTLDRIENGETGKEALDRFNGAVEEILTEEKDKDNIGIVSHGHILTFFTAQFMQIDMYSYHKTIQMPDVAILDWNTKKFINVFNSVKAS